MSSMPNVFYAVVDVGNKRMIGGLVDTIEESMDIATELTIDGRLDIYVSEVVLFDYWSVQYSGVLTRLRDLLTSTRCMDMYRKIQIVRTIARLTKDPYDVAMAQTLAAAYGLSEVSRCKY